MSRGLKYCITCIETVEQKKEKEDKIKEYREQKAIDRLYDRFDSGEEKYREKARKKMHYWWGFIGCQILLIMFASFLHFNHNFSAIDEGCCGGLILIFIFSNFMESSARKEFKSFN